MTVICNDSGNHWSTEGCYNALDSDAQCETWAAEGGCTSNAEWMAISCKRACFQCAEAQPPPGETQHSCFNTSNFKQKISLGLV